jgi:hypothetical protein
VAKATFQKINSWNKELLKSFTNVLKTAALVTWQKGGKFDWTIGALPSSGVLVRRSGMVTTVSATAAAAPTPVPEPACTFTLTLPALFFVRKSSSENYTTEKRKSQNPHSINFSRQNGAGGEIQFKPSPHPTKSKLFKLKSLRYPNAFDRKRGWRRRNYFFYTARKEFVFKKMNGNLILVRVVDA